MSVSKVSAKVKKGGGGLSQSKRKKANKKNAHPTFITPQNPKPIVLKKTIQTTTARQPGHQPSHQASLPTTPTPLIRIIPSRRRGSLLVIHALLLLRRIPSSTVVLSLRRRGSVGISSVRVRCAAAVVAGRRGRALVVVACVGRWVGLAGGW